MKYQFNNKLWLIYQNTYFDMPKLPNLKKNLCVITACNPFGTTLSNEQNIYRNSELAHDLDAMANDVIELSAGNIDFSYCETSFIFECDKEQAVELGKKWQQNAIFWIEQGTLYLIACRPIDGKTPESVCLGAFLERTKIK